MIHTTRPARYYRLKAALYMFGALMCAWGLFLGLGSDAALSVAEGLWGLWMAIRAVQYARIAEEADRHA